jgi:hypothetical protein
MIFVLTALAIWYGDTLESERDLGLLELILSHNTSRLIHSNM